MSEGEISSPERPDDSGADDLALPARESTHRFDDVILGLLGLNARFFQLWPAALGLGRQFLTFALDGQKLVTGHHIRLLRGDRQ